LPTSPAEPSRPHRYRFFGHPADLRSYTITVQDGERTHMVLTSDALDDPALRDLVEHLRARA
jgi:hypothetical protein